MHVAIHYSVICRTAMNQWVKCFGSDSIKSYLCYLVIALPLLVNILILHKTWRLFPKEDNVPIQKCSVHGYTHVCICNTHVYKHVPVHTRAHFFVSTKKHPLSYASRDEGLFLVMPKSTCSVHNAILPIHFKLYSTAHINVSVLQQYSSKYSGNKWQHISRILSKYFTIYPERHTYIQMRFFIPVLLEDTSSCN